MYKAVQNVTEACHYTLYFKTQQACISTGMSGGDIFLVILFTVSAVYFGGGALYSYLALGKLQILHKEFWTGLPGVTIEGLVFLKDLASGGGNRNTFRPVSGEAPASDYDASAVSYQTYGDDAGQELGGGDTNAAAAYADL